MIGFNLPINGNRLLPESGEHDTMEKEIQEEINLMWENIMALKRMIDELRERLESRKGGGK